jgi:hypothetical protein
MGELDSASFGRYRDFALAEGTRKTLNQSNLGNKDNGRYQDYTKEQRCLE